MSKKILSCGLVCYPESIPNLESFFSELEKNVGVGFKAILHDKDKNKDGELKKPHYHILFQGVLSSVEWKRVYALSAVKHHVDFYTADDAEKYLTHEGKTDKFHYSSDDVITSKTWDVDTWEDILEKEKELKEKSEDADNTLFEIIQAIEENNISNIRQLTKWVMSNMDKSAVSVVVSKSYFFNTYMKDVD